MGGLGLLTVDIHTSADIGDAQWVGDLAGNRLSKERVVHDDLIDVAGNFLDHTAALSPPNEKTGEKSKLLLSSKGIDPFIYPSLSWFAEET